MNNYIKLIYISLFLLLKCGLYGQTYLSNPSLEDKPADATMPTGWFAGTTGTTPDILPGYWGVYTEPEDGESYVGLITRKDGSYESISQRLETKLKKETCYSLSLYLAYSENYSGYNTPLKLRIWIGSKKNKREQLIFTSPTISEEEWQEFKVKFNPEKNMKYFIIEAYNDSGQNVEGNILIDKISGPRFCNKA